MKLHEIKSPLVHPESDPEDETPLREHSTDQQKNPTHPFKTDLLFICSQYLFVSHRSCDFTTKSSNFTFLLETE